MFLVATGMETSRYWNLVKEPFIPIASIPVWMAEWESVLQSALLLNEECCWLWRKMGWQGKGTEQNVSSDGEHTEEKRHSWGVEGFFLLLRCFFLGLSPPAEALLLSLFPEALLLVEEAPPLLAEAPPLFPEVPPLP